MKSKLLELEIDEKIFKIVCVVSAFAIVLFCSALYLELGSLGNYRIPSDIETATYDEIPFHIDSIQTSRKYIEISGWAYKKGQNIGYFDNRYVIQNVATGKYKSLHTEMTNVDELYSVDGKYDCRRAGMYAKSIAVGLKKGVYKIYIEYKNDDENYLVDTGYTFQF